MEIRKIKSAERIYSSFIGSVSYLGKMSAEYIKKLKNPAQDDGERENIWGGFDETGKLCSRLVLCDYDVRFDFHVAKLCGVAGVATLPEHRNGGYVREMFKQILPEMKERGYIFSYLYPFSYAFYRKFGYELCYSPNAVTIPTSFFNDFPFPDNVSMYEPEGTGGNDGSSPGANGAVSNLTADKTCSVSDFMSVYDTFAAGKNLSVVRDRSAWEDIINKDPYTTCRYAYLHRDESGAPDSYLLFNADSFAYDKKNTFRVTETAWSTPVGMRAIFGFIKTYAPQFVELKWESPSGFDVRVYFPECADIKIERPACGMNRIVNVPAALSMLKTPDKPGGAAIKITDEMIPSNSGTYKIEWDNGTVSTGLTDKTSDFETDIQTLTQLVTGFINFDAASLKNGVIVNGNVENLRALFPCKDMYLWEKF